MFDAQMNRWIDHRNRQTELLVTHPAKGRTLLRWDLATWVLVMGCWLVTLWTDPGWVHALATPVVGGFIGFHSFRRVTRAQAYRGGWLDGRMQMISSMAEAQRRDLSLDEWVRSQWERDALLLGIPPHLPGEEEEP